MKLENIKAAFLGDSITEGAGTSDKQSKTFARILAKKYHMDAEIDGISGTRFARQIVPTEGKPDHDKDYCMRIIALKEGAELVVIFGGTNDFGHGDAPFGEDGDRTPDTFIGACHYLFRNALERFPDAKIVVMTPMHRISEDVPNRNGRVLREYVEKIKEVAAHYSLPIIDLWSLSGIQPRVDIIKAKFCPDGLHPNDAGHVKLAEVIEAALLAM